MALPLAYSLKSEVLLRMGKKPTRQVFFFGLNRDGNYRGAATGRTSSPLVKQAKEDMPCGSFWLCYSVD